MPDFKRKLLSLPPVETLVVIMRRILVSAGLIKRRYETEFTSLYRSNYWGSAESVSGGGSSLAETEAIRTTLPMLFREYNIRSILDVPCGDFNWMSSIDLSDIRYLGGDIVAEIIEKNSRVHNQRNLNFFQTDIINDALPMCDLIMCRDCLVHLPLADVRKALHNFIRSRSKFLLTTTFHARSENSDIAPGKWRPINLQAAPFCFPPPLVMINEQCTEAAGAYADKSLGLWRLEDLKRGRFGEAGRLGFQP